MKIIIFGVGFLGTKLMNLLSKKNEVIGTNINPKSDLIKNLDATDKETVKEFLLKEKPQIVIDTIALTSSVACEKNPELCKELNYQTAKNIADVCKEIGAKMIFISSSYVFEGKNGNYSEKDEPFATNEYAKTKILAEQEISKLNDFLILRVDLMYGVENNKIKFGAGTFDREIIEVGFPNQLRSPLFIDDVPKVLDSLIEKDQKGFFHIAGPDRILMIDFLKKLAELENARDKIKIVDSSNWLVKSPHDSSLDISKINSLGIQTTSFKDAFEILKESIK
jgi:dTDP-4-dehydrorhamnose reductase